MCRILCLTGWTGLPWKLIRGQAMEITSAAYLKTMERMENRPEYEMFHEVISLMRRERIRLEQEQMIV